jgi:hypothetical protein
MRRALAWVTVFMMGCGKVAGGGATDASTGGGSGGQAGASGGSAGKGGAGALGGGGHSENGGAAGDVSSGGAGGSDACFDASGSLVPSAKRCAKNTDCTTLLIPTCCGSDEVVGISRTAACSPPAIDCSGLGCAKFVYPRAEDGVTTEGGGSVAVRCEFGPSGVGACRSFVTSDAGAAPYACGASTCAPHQACVHPPTSIGGPPPPCMPPSDAGACPPGTEYNPSCGGLPGGGCVTVYVPPPPFCVDIPATCTSSGCGCFPPDVCGGGANICNAVNGRDVLCVNVAP